MKQQEIIAVPNLETRFASFSQAVRGIGVEQVVQAKFTMVNIADRWTKYVHTNEVQEWLIGNTPDGAELNVDHKSQTINLTTHVDPNIQPSLPFFHEAFHPLIAAYGIEIECFSGWTHSEVAETIREYDVPANDLPLIENNEWRVEPDLTIQPQGNWEAAEVKSPILAPEEVDDQVESVCSALHELAAKTDLTCGLHIHVSDRYLGANDKAKIAWQWIRNESTIDRLMTPIRRKNKNDHTSGWSDLLKSGNLSEMREELSHITDEEILIATVNPTGRRYKVNFRTTTGDAGPPKQTVEFRQHHGTVDAEDIVQWKDFLTAFCEYSVDTGFSENISPDPLPNLLQILAMYLPEEKQGSFIDFFTYRSETIGQDTNETLKDNLCNEEILETHKPLVPHEEDYEWYPGIEPPDTWTNNDINDYHAPERPPSHLTFQQLLEIHT